MITVKMADKDVIYPPESYPVLSKLDLCSLTAIYQIKPLMHIQHMSGLVSF